MFDNKESRIVVSIILVLTCTTFTLYSQKIYNVRWKQSSTIIGSGITLFGGAAYIEDLIVPHTAEDIALLNKEAVIGIDQSTIGNYSLESGFNSDYLKVGALITPFTLFLSNQARKNAAEILVMYAEVFSFNTGITQFNKVAFGRYRPYAYNPKVDLEFKLQPSAKKSFFSGHVSHVSSLCYFTATVFDDLYPESDFKYVIWTGAIVAPAITGYLRVKAGQHFPTDVIVGYSVGAIVGYFIPEFHKITKGTDISIFGTAGGLGLAYNF